MGIKVRDQQNSANAWSRMITEKNKTSESSEINFPLTYHVSQEYAVMVI